MLHAPATSASLSVSALLLYSYALLAWPPKRSGRSGRSGSLAPRSHSASFNRRRPHACSTGRGPCDGPATALRRRAFRSVQQPPPRSSASSLLVAVPSLARWLAALSPHACQARSNGRSACLSVPAIVLHAQPYLAEPSSLSPWPLPCRRAQIPFCIRRPFPPSLPFGSAQALPVIVQSRLAATPPHCIPPPTDTDSQVTFPSATLMLDAPVHQRAWPHSSTAPSLAA